MVGNNFARKQSGIINYAREVVRDRLIEIEYGVSEGALRGGPDSSKVQKAMDAMALVLVNLKRDEAARQILVRILYSVT
ncbi:Uncharacterised protein [uncultured archaeon]|nr:Uncharacterised protein [uncultured archaeon]